MDFTVLLLLAEEAMNTLTDFDADENDSDEDYFAFVHDLEDVTVAELLAARENVEAQKQAIKRYFLRGLKANLTMGELWDFLGVSSPSILERAGFEETDEKSATSTEIASQSCGEVIKEFDA